MNKNYLISFTDKLTITSITCLSKEPWSSYKDFIKEGLPLWMTSVFCLYWVIQITQRSFHNSRVVPWLFWMFPFFLHTSEHNLNSLPRTLTRPRGPRRWRKKWTLRSAQLHDTLCLLTFVYMMVPCCCWRIWRQCVSKLDEVEIMQGIEHNIISLSIDKNFLWIYRILCGHT